MVFMVAEPLRKTSIRGCGREWSLFCYCFWGWNPAELILEPDLSAVHILLLSGSSALTAFPRGYIFQKSKYLFDNKMH